MEKIGAANAHVGPADFRRPHAALLATLIARVIHPGDSPGVASDVAPAAQIRIAVKSPVLRHGRKDAEPGACLPVACLPGRCRARGPRWPGAPEWTSRKGQAVGRAPTGEGR